MAFIKDIWYAAAWSYELPDAKPIARTIIGEPIVFYRRANGSVVAMEDRCAHRHAPLSLGRVEGDDLRCMYHGLLFGSDGRCTLVPGGQTAPTNAVVKTYPVHEKAGWIWIWTGESVRADIQTIPDAQGLDHPDFTMTAGAIDYAADYQLINDNLCDLSHLDFVHETTLGKASGSKWSEAQPSISNLEDGLLYERWFVDRKHNPGNSLVDAWMSYRFLLPGIFLMHVTHFPSGTAAASGHKAPTAVTPLSRRYEQQAVTPISEGRARYLYATGLDPSNATPEMLNRNAKVVQAAFEEDRRMIEAQQAIWLQTAPDHPKVFLAQDKGPAWMRRKIERRLTGGQPNGEG